MKKTITALDNVTKILLIILVVAVTYFIFSLALRPFFVPKSMMEMMSQITGGIGTSDIISFIIALLIGITTSFYLFKIENKNSDKENKFKIIKKVLSEDERKILDEVKKARGITQDSLRFRLGWSKAKISTMLSNLDRKSLVQRERTGKTYKIYLQKV